jgi:hypothetical protein
MSSSARRASLCWRASSRRSVSVAEDELQVHWFEAPEDGYRNVAIAGRARGAAAELSRDLAALGGRRPWVQSIVVLWADFEQGVSSTTGSCGRTAAGCATS